ncbi:MAG: phosphatase PAP2 family protein [Candidatus Sungbacteria bacterium]|nr:phosphatase PAP2 family protein [Candidatus Sungbacteria bacterium]
MNILDLELFSILNSLAGINEFWDGIIIFLASWTLYFMIAGVVIFPIIPYISSGFYGFWRKNKEFFLTALLSSFIARFLLTELIRILYYRPRPFSIAPEILAKSQVYVIQLLPHASSSSFPSGHAAFAFALAFAVYYYYPRLGGVFFAVAILMGAARVAAGVHWPLDILGGAVAGIGSAWLLCVLRDWYFKK